MIGWSLHLHEEPLAAQSMLYFKPAGARGQALHQGNFYLKVEPGTCIAAWVALDRADRANGGLEVVPSTHAMGLFCNGSLVHGSGPNRARDRFRRAFIGHYIGRSSERLSRWYRPILTMAGAEGSSPRTPAAAPAAPRQPVRTDGPARDGHHRLPNVLRSHQDGNLAPRKG